jgi:hypothetical protein
MKLKFTPKALNPLLIMTMVAGLLFTQPLFAIGKPVKKFGLGTNDKPKEDKPVKKAKIKTKTFSSLNNSSVKIYPDIVKREMHVVAKENDGKEIDFFVFDIDGTLLEHYKMKAKDHHKISGLARGSYVYRIFIGDEETATGNFEIR